MVQHPAAAEPVAPRRRRVLGAAALAAVAALLVACGDEDGSDPAVAIGGPSIGVAIELADCADWNEATVEERIGTIDQIENFAGGPVGTAGGRGAVLSDEDAYDVMEGYCTEEFARGFRLYKLYTRAAAFQGS